MCNGDMITTVCEVRYTGMNVLLTNVCGSYKMVEMKNIQVRAYDMDEHRNDIT